MTEEKTDETASPREEKYNLRTTSHPTSLLNAGTSKNSKLQSPLFHDLKQLVCQQHYFDYGTNNMKQKNKYKQKTMSLQIHNYKQKVEQISISLYKVQLVLPLDTLQLGIFPRGECL